VIFLFEVVMWELRNEAFASGLKGFMSYKVVFPRRESGRSEPSSLFGFELAAGEQWGVGPIFY